MTDIGDRIKAAGLSGGPDPNLGMAYPLPDPLLKGLAVTIMFGLLFATVPTLVVAPVLHAANFGIGPPLRGIGGGPETGHPDGPDGPSIVGCSNPRSQTRRASEIK